MKEEKNCKHGNKADNCGNCELEGNKYKPMTPKTPQQEDNIDSKAKFIKEYMNDHNGGTPRWLRGAFYDEKEKIEAILECMDNIEKATLRAFVEAEITAWKRVKLDMDTVVCDCGEPYKDSDPANLIEDQISHLKRIKTLKI